MANKQRKGKNFFNWFFIHSVTEAKHALWVGGWMGIIVGFLFFAATLENGMAMFLLSIITIGAGLLVLRGTLEAVLVLVFVLVGFVVMMNVITRFSPGIFELIILYLVNRMAMARRYLLHPPTEK